MNYLFLDTEATGKDRNRCSIIEVAGFFVNSNLEKKDKFKFVINPGCAYWEPEALQMHLDSGLVEEIEKGVSEDSAKEGFKAFVLQFLEKTPHDQKVFLAGSSVWADKILMENRWGTEYVEGVCGTHQVIDVSSISKAYEDKFGFNAAAKIEDSFLMNHVPHRAMHDANYSFELFKILMNHKV